jgi:alkylhydroperoxidase/carboxymuconolactone decarboxylase family protein YurZ
MMSAAGSGGGMAAVGHEETLRKLAVRDDEYVEWILAHEREGADASALGPKTDALVRIGALVGIDAAPPSYLPAVESALRHGATAEEIVGTLIAVMPTVGSARVVSAAPKLALALGYDVAEALEHMEGSGRRPSLADPYG